MNASDGIFTTRYYHVEKYKDKDPKFDCEFM
mgnify:CR=1 FL=1